MRNILWTMVLGLAACGDEAPSDAEIEARAIDDLLDPANAPECAGAPPTISGRDVCAERVCRRATSRPLGEKLGKVLAAACVEPPLYAWSETHPCADMVCEALGRDYPTLAIELLTNGRGPSLRSDYAIGRVVHGFEARDNTSALLEGVRGTRAFARVATQVIHTTGLAAVVRSELAAHPDAVGVDELIDLLAHLDRSSFTEVAMKYLGDSHIQRAHRGIFAIVRGGLSAAELSAHRETLNAFCHPRRRFDTDASKAFCQRLESLHQPPAETP